MGGAGAHHSALVLTWIPKYFFKAPRIDDFDAIKQRQDLTYLDMPPDAVREMNKPKVAPKLPPNKPLIDKQTMDEMKKQAEQAPPPPPPQQQAPEQPKPQPTQPVPPNPQSQAPEAPRPQAVPAKPNFAMGSQNPADQLRQDMQNAMHGQGQQNYGNPGSGGLSMHPGAGTGGAQVLSDTQGVDFSSWIARWHYITQRTWDPLIPDEVNPPILKSGSGRRPLQSAAQRPGHRHAVGWPLRRHGAGPRGLGCDYGIELSAAAAGVPRSLSRVARLLPLQHAAAVRAAVTML